MRKGESFKKLSIVTLFLVLLLVALAACGGGSESSSSNDEEESSTESDSAEVEESEDASDDPLKVGIMLSFTGPYAPLAEGVQNGFDLYLKQNDNKLGGREVEVIYEDDENDQKQALTKYRQLLTSDNVDVMVGTISSSITYSLLERLDQDEMVLIKPIPSGNEKTWDNRSEYIFPNLVSNYQNGAAAAEYLAENVGKTAVTIASDYVAGHEVIEAFKHHFEEAGGEVVEEIWEDLGTNDFATSITNISQVNPDFVYAFVVGSDGLRLVSQYDEFGIKDEIPFTGALEFGDPLLTEPTGETAEGIISAGIYSPWLENEVNENFVQAYEEEYDRLPDIFAVGGYDAAQMIDLAVTETGSTSSVEIAEALKGITFESPRGTTTIDAETRIPVADFFISENVMEDGRIVHKILDEVKGLEMPTSNPVE